MLSSYYPERLGQVTLVDAPGLFSMMFTAFKAVMDARQLSKIQFISGAEQREKVFEEQGECCLIGLAGLCP